MCLRRTVSLSVKVCRICHRLLPATALTCPGCGKYNLVAVRCRIDKQDLEDYFRAFPKQKS